MGKKQLLIVCIVIVLALVAIALFVWLRASNNNVTAINSTTTSMSSTTTVVVSSSLSSPTLTATSTNSYIWGEYVVNEPNALILVDSQGRRTGKDPITGILYHEIPNTSYKEEAVNPGHFNGELFVSNLPDGQYTLYVLGGKTGSYALNVANGHGQQEFHGNVQGGSMIAYVQNYNSSNLASSTFSFEGAMSSTMIITSAPPHNLPLPPPQ